jgi:hypothetical protein
MFWSVLWDTEDGADAYIVNSEGDRVATMWDGTNESDARLAAAAPEMLEALRACEAALYGLGNDHRIDSAWAKARDAIARATTTG